MMWGSNRFETDDAERPVLCPNCQEATPTVDGECWGCGYTGHCRICREATEDFGDYPDLNYCSTACAREAHLEAEADRA